jgi:hypothetical protein
MHTSHLFSHNNIFDLNIRNDLEFDYIRGNAANILENNDVYHIMKYL